MYFHRNRNSKFGTRTCFDFRVFEGQGSMAIIAATWGIWHAIAGVTLAWFWSKKTSTLKT
ncbi:hypothetical protein LEP1GSC151_0768 [Leptospira interrogans serovar Grippotyphosa str. LT2186]|uniref:Uncharacterized protein n=1 Tax=Leptospira interrogans serovar Grippotyphosa str. LT2186 TaxID=1001599 RepID=M3HZ82_LEPIR|nr:hypothetical protein LEP1GSC151_0768 [Leptospira interrogans serovar Grippotyphosa str. LT2186]